MFLLPCVSDYLAARSAGSGEHTPHLIPKSMAGSHELPELLALQCLTSQSDTKEGISQVPSLGAESSVRAQTGLLLEPPADSAQPSAGLCGRRRAGRL